MFVYSVRHVTHLPPPRGRDIDVQLPPLFVPGLVPPPGALARPRTPPRPVPLARRRGLRAEALGAGGQPRSEVSALLRDGVSVCGIDLFMQGDFLLEDKPLRQTRRVENRREAACYTLGYNRPLFAQRVDDILSAIQMIRADLHAAQKIDLVGLEGAGHWAAAANFAAGKALDRVTVETAGFRFIKIDDIRHPDLMPGASKYGDIDALLSLATNRVWSVDAKGLPPWLR